MDKCDIRVLDPCRLDVLFDCKLNSSTISYIIDKNECKVENGGCSQNCINTRGSYKCECSDGYKLAEDGKKCLRKSDVTSLPA